MHGPAIDHHEYVKLPFEGQSSYRADFVEHPMERGGGFAAGLPSPAHARAYNSDIKFQGSSETRDRFVEHPLERPSPTRLPERTVNPSKFDATSSYRAEYTEKPLEAPSHPAASQAPAQRYSAPFDGMSETRAVYVAHPVEVARRGPRPSTSSGREHIPFTGSTETRDRFVAHEIEAPHAPQVAASPAPRNPHRFEATSTYSSDYDEKQADPSSLRWEGRGQTPSSSQRPHLPFTGTTETRDRFVPHPLDRDSMMPSSPLPPAPHVNPHKFDGTSSYRSDFVPKQIEQQPHYRPATASAPQPDSRDFLSESRKEYTPKAMDASRVCPAALVPPPPGPAVRPSAWNGQHVLYDVNQRHYA